MPAETFQCPHCRRTLKKSAAAYVLGEAGGFVAFGDVPHALPCPGCGGPIEVRRMIAGEYDRKPAEGDARTMLGWLVLAAFFYLGLGWGGWAAVGAGLGATAALYFLTEALPRRVGRPLFLLALLAAAGWIVHVLH